MQSSQSATRIYCDLDGSECMRCSKCDEPQKVMICSECGTAIYEGDSYRFLGGGQYCDRCIENSIRFADSDALPY